MKGYVSLLLLVVALAFSSCRQGNLLTSAKPHDASSADVNRLTPEEQLKFNYFYLEAVRQSEADHNSAAFELLQHCRQINPAASEVNYSLSQFYVALKDTTNALDCLEKAAACAPRNTDYAETLAMTYVRYKRYDLAIQTYEEILKNHPERSDLLDNLYMLYSQSNEYDHMIATLDRMEVVEGKSEKLSEEKFRIYVSQDKPKKAFEEMESLANKYPNDLRYRVVIGKMLIANGNEKGGVDMLDGVLKKEPDNTMAKMAFMDYYKSKGEDSLYNVMLRQVLTNKNTEPEVRMGIMRGVVSENEQKGGDSTQVIRLFRDIISQTQKGADMNELLASYMIMKKMSTDTIAPVLRRIIDATPDNAFARLQLIGYAWQKKDLDDVISLCRPALQYNPDEMAFYYYLGMAYYQKNKTDAALQTFQKGVGVINPQSDAGIVSDFYAVMGDILHEKGKEKEAYAAYDSCLQWKDDNVGCLNNYAYYLSVNGKNLSKAEQMSYKTVKAEPNNSTFLDTYAWILFQQNRFTEAKMYIDQAIRNDSDSSAVIVEHAGDIYAKNNDMTTALEYWRKAAQKATDNKLLYRKIKYKKYIRE